MVHHSKASPDNAHTKAALIVLAFVLTLFLAVAILMGVLVGFGWMVLRLLGYPYSLMATGEIGLTIMPILFSGLVIGRWLIRAYHELCCIFSGKKYHHPVQ